MSNNIVLNAGCIFFKEYYKDIIKNGGNIDFKNINKKLLNIKYVSNSNVVTNIKGLQSFKMKTIYPGLLIGSGYNHDISNDDVFKIGFYFDHTTGMPLIPGSSIKGMLRSFFPNKYKEDRLSKEDRKVEAKVKILNSLLSEWGRLELTENEIEQLESQIFDGKISDAPNTNIYSSLYNRDIFFDAYPINKSTSLFEVDYITPHVNKDGEEDINTNPKPIKFLKVAPGVEYQFLFKLCNSKLDSGKEITAEIKLDLLYRLIMIAGLGAKTNVGYGKFGEDLEYKKAFDKNKLQYKYKEAINASIKLEEDQKVQKALSEEEKRMKEAEQREQKKRKEAEEKEIIEIRKLERQESATKTGIIDLLKIFDIEQLLKKTWNWAEDLSGDKNIKKCTEKYGEIIPSEYRDKYIEHVKEICKNNSENNRFKKVWAKQQRELNRLVGNVDFGNFLN